MPRGRRWTPAEDAAVRRASRQTRRLGIAAHGRDLEHGDYHARLRDVARQLGRTYAAVRMRASRIDARSYERHEDAD